MKFRSLLLAMLTYTTGFMMGLASVQSDAATDQPTAQWMHRACSYEDSANCFWDAGRGNGVGHSFYVHTMDAEVGQKTYKRLTCLMYTDHNFAQHHDRCFSEQANARLSSDRDLDGSGTEAR